MVPATVELGRAELRARGQLGFLLGAQVPDSWPPELYDRAAAEYTIRRLEEGPEQAGWWLYYVVLRSAGSEGPVLIGTCGFKGPPTADGTVEIGYGIVPESRRRGYAAEAVRGLVTHAFRIPEVRRVIAETLPGLAPSIGVLRKTGFRYIGEGSEDGVIRFELPRAAFENS